MEKTQAQVLLIIDSMEEYQAKNPGINRSVGALVRFVGIFNSENASMKIKLGLPSEIFPEIQRTSANPLKDFIQFEQIKWKSIELVRIAAFRYKLFLEMHDNDWYKVVSGVDIKGRDGVLTFWDKFVPTVCFNKYNQTENSLVYILRHTQLIPRQFFSILQKVVILSNKETGGYRKLSEKAIRESIENMEPIIAGEVFQAFTYVYPFADRLGRAIFGNFPTTFLYHELRDRWDKVGGEIMEKVDPSFGFVHFSEMVLRMGIVGVVEGITDQYVEAKFAYNMLMPFSLGDGNECAVHRIFSQYYSCAPNHRAKAILPLGSDFASDP